jgi:two-component system, sensor histidine kinase and response regulator
MDTLIHKSPDTLVPFVQVDSINILIVDDLPENLLSLESILEKEGRNIIKASSGNEALKIARETELALIILDVQMPEMDGFEVAHLLSENPATKDISVLFVTALSYNEKYTIQGYKEGAVDYLQKPLDSSIVKAKVNVFEKIYRQRMKLKESNEKLLATNKQLDEFVYIVSHDLKAPLRGLSSICSFLDEELGNDQKKEVSELLVLLKRRTAWMQALIDGILHYSRLANAVGEKEVVHLNELIDNIIEMISPPSNIRFEIADNMPVLNAERIKIHEVFQNLISNAVKYNDKAEGVIRISHLDFPDHYEFIIQDNGCGIKPEHFQRIFGIFQTLGSKEKSESTGIGLTIVKKIVEQQSGSVSLTSEYGVGTTFRFIWKK